MGVKPLVCLQHRQHVNQSAPCALCFVHRRRRPRRRGAVPRPEGQEDHRHRAPGRRRRLRVRRPEAAHGDPSALDVASPGHAAGDDAGRTMMDQTRTG